MTLMSCTKGAPGRLLRQGGDSFSPATADGPLRSSKLRAHPNYQAIPEIGFDRGLAKLFCAKVIIPDGLTVPSWPEAPPVGGSGPVGLLRQRLGGLLRHYEVLCPSRPRDPGFRRRANRLRPDDHRGHGRICHLSRPRCPFEVAAWRLPTYRRRLQDLPVQSAPVSIELTVTRWRRRNGASARQSFSGCPPDLARPFARRTRQTACLSRLIAHAAGGRPAERLVRLLGHPAKPSHSVARGLSR
jgi:hypothetical protein